MTTAVIGIGNPFRGDDGVAAAVVERLRAVPAPATVHLLDGEPTRLLDTWEGLDRVVIVDAMRSGAPPGTVRRIEIDPLADDAARALPTQATTASTHGNGLAEAIALGAVLGRLPGALVVFAIEGADFDDGPCLSPSVAAAVDGVVEQVDAEVAR